MRLAMLLSFSSILFASDPSPTPATRSFTVTCEYALKDIPDGAALAEVWLPVPISDRFQKIQHLEIDAPSVDFSRDAEYGNRFAYVRIEKPSNGMKIRLSIVATRSETPPFEEVLVDSQRERFLAADRLGVVDQEVKDTAARVTAGLSGDLEKARAIYDHVVGVMEYDKQAPGWGNGDTKRALQVCKGNCSDFHAMFISLCRASGIPARFHYGMAISHDAAQGEPVAHCWAMFYADGRWVPVDCSEARKHPEQRDYFFGHLDENRIVFTTGRDITLSPQQAGGSLNFIIHPYVEVDGKPGAMEHTYRYGLAQ